MIEGIMKDLELIRDFRRWGLVVGFMKEEAESSSPAVWRLIDS